MNEQHNLRQETAAAQVLTAHLQDLLADDIDDVVIRDSIEGETNLHEAIERAALVVLSSRSNVAALKEMIAALTKRRDRYAQREDLLRTAILSAMEIGMIKEKIELPFATISSAVKPRALEIIDEAIIPSDYWKPSDPKLDKKAVIDVLKGGKQIPGITLDNGGTRLVIRWS